MPKPNRVLSFFTTGTAYLATVQPTWWLALLTAIGAALGAVYASGLRWIASPEAHGEMILFFGVFLSFIGLVYLATKGKSLEIHYRNDMRYGLTFEGIYAGFWPHTEDTALQLQINLRNYSPHTIRYNVEYFRIYIETRSIVNEDGSPIFLSRGAARSYYGSSFKLSHIKEFFGKQIDGKAEFAILYGDIDGKPERRLKMTFKTFYSFPMISSDSSGITQAFPISPFGFNCSILSESDEEI